MLCSAYGFKEMIKLNKVVIIDSVLSERFLNENKNKIKKYGVSQEMG